ncbi:MAG: ferrochelatase [Candidatus Omnitrophica bacterium]|nr:ferrochelatase [Candidatus Omnitrophota bacterium]
MFEAIAPYLLVLSVALLSNIPCGYLRQGYAKFSFPWFLWIHASIPLLIYLRITTGVSPWIIPLSIFCAVIGQVFGSRMRLQRQDQEETERIAQIPHLNRTKTNSIKDDQVLIALLNMGGPRNLEDIKAFQKCLFEDDLLIRFPLSFLLQKFFAWVLIFFRLNAVKERYKMIGGRSPIYQSTTAQAQALREELRRRGRDVMVTFSFNYSPPFPEDTVNKARRSGKKYILPLSLYPHYSKATTGSNMHYLKKSLDHKQADIALLPAPSYYLHDGYIQAFVDRILESLKEGERLEDFYLMFSAHGLPLYFLTEGDPYPFQVSQTVAKILGKLDRDANWSLCYQSAVGPLQWLKPSTDDMLTALAGRGIRKILVVPVSFVGDHIETIHEIDIEYRELADELKIEDFRMTKAIESHQGFITALADTVERSINGGGPVRKIIPDKNKAALPS